MREEPRAPELIEAVADFLRREVLPALDGRLAFHARVAANVLDICRREVLTGQAAEGRESARLFALLGAEGDAAGLNEALCAAIRDGTLAADDPKLIDHLWSTTLDTLAVDQPRYETYRRAAQHAGRNNGEE
jgi:hypothetical protein